MIKETPVRSYETVHDYSLLEPLSHNRRLSTAPLLMAALAIAIAAWALIYSYMSAAPKLVPGTYFNSTVIVDAAGHIVSVTQGIQPTAFVTALANPPTVVPSMPPSTLFPDAVTESAKKPLPWSPPSDPLSRSSRPDVSTLEPGPAAPVGPETVPTKVVENFVKFHSVKFKTGVVDTGWRYADSNAKEPESQWCYYKSYEVGTKGFQATIDLKDDVDPDAVHAIGLSQDEFVEAQGKCQWFNNVKPFRGSLGKTY
jgi:hypothetical protein